MAMHLDTLGNLLRLFGQRGATQYSGEPVTQIEHALQCGLLAERTGYPAPLIAAALLHDVGHMISDLGETPTLRGVDDHHQYHGARALRRLFGEEVTEPIRLHVDAKRYLCAVEEDYYARLSDDSRRSLGLQGGVFSPAEAREFIRLPYARDAVWVRRWDDGGKLPGLALPDLDYFIPILGACLRG